MSQGRGADGGVGNEVACAQHVSSLIYCHATFSCDSNVLYTEIVVRVVVYLGLQASFHEKPVVGVDGSGKHNNRSIGTDAGLNFFYPGRSVAARVLLATGIACLACGLCQASRLVCVCGGSMCVLACVMQQAALGSSRSCRLS